MDSSGEWELCTIRNGRLTCENSIDGRFTLGRYRDLQTGGQTPYGAL